MFLLAGCLFSIVIYPRVLIFCLHTDFLVPKMVTNATCEITFSLKNKNPDIFNEMHDFLFRLSEAGDAGQNCEEIVARLLFLNRISDILNSFHDHIRSFNLKLGQQFTQVVHPTE